MGEDRALPFGIPTEAWFNLPAMDWNLLRGTSCAFDISNNETLIFSVLDGGR